MSFDFRLRSFTSRMRFVRRSISALEKFFGMPLASRPRACAALFIELEFKKVVRPTVLVGHSRLAKNQSLSTTGYDFHETLIEHVHRGAQPVRDDLGNETLTDGLGSDGVALLKSAPAQRRFKHAEFETLPFSVNRDSFLNGALYRLQSATTRVKFAVKHYTDWQLFDKPFRRRERIPISTTQLAAIPDRAKAIQFLRHKPALDVLTRVFTRKHRFDDSHVNTISGYGESVNCFFGVFKPMKAGVL